MNISGLAVGGDAPCRFVLEIGNAHNGSLALAHRLIDEGSKTGAEFLKTQAYLPSELVALRGDGPAPAQWGEQGYTMRSLYERAQTPLAWLPELFQHARDVGLVPFSSVFGLASLAALQAVNCGAYKIARLDNGHSAFIESVNATDKPTIISADHDEDCDGVVADAWLWCPKGYPADVHHSLPMFRDDETREGWPLGLSSHCLDPRLPIAAVARGAKMIEMHVMLDDEPSALEANISLTVTQFAQMVADVRATEVMLG